MTKIDYVYMSGFAQLPMPFVNCDWLTFQQKMQISILINFQGETKRSYPKRETQAYYMGVSRETVSTYTKASEINRVLKVKRHNSGNSNEYDIYLTKEMIAYHIWKEALIKKAEEMIENTKGEAERKYKNDEFYKKLHSIQVHLGKLGKEISNAKNSVEAREQKYKEIITYLKETLKLDVDKFEDTKVEKKTKKDLEKKKNQPQEEEVENKEAADQEVDALFSDVPSQPQQNDIKENEVDFGDFQSVIKETRTQEKAHKERTKQSATISVEKTKDEQKKTTQQSSQSNNVFRFKQNVTSNSY